MRLQEPAALPPQIADSYFVYPAGGAAVRFESFGWLRSLAF